MSCRAWPSGLLDLHGRGRDGRGRVVEVDRRDDGAQALGVEDADVLLVDLDEAVMGEAREHAAHGLELEAEVGADFGARHAQHELAAGVAAVFEALGERQEEGGKTLTKTTQLKTSIRSEVSDSGLAVGTNDIRAATHQFGDERTIRAKNKKYLTFKIGGQWKRVASVKVSIPPRPFLGISEEDEQDIKDTLEEIFEE